MTRSQRNALSFWMIVALVGVMLVSVMGITRMVRAQDRVPQAATDWRALTAAPQSVDLASLKPLPVVHYSWPIRAEDVLPTPAWWLHDYIRITKGATIHAETSTTEAHVRALCKVAKQYAASVAILMAPYHHASWSDGDPRHVDPSYWPWWAQRLTAMKGWVESEGCRVEMIIFDCERFILKTAESEPDALARAKWNTAARTRYDEAYDQIKTIFGESCYVEWYSRGWYRPIGLARQQRMAGPYYHFDLSEKGDGVSVVITRPDWTAPSIASVYETALRSPGANDPLITWIYVACGYKLSDDLRTLSFVDDWHFDPAATKELARVQADFRGRLRAVIFYPEPGRNRGWLLHFKAYAESAGR